MQTDERKQYRKTSEWRARVGPLLDRRALAFEMGLGLATATAISLQALKKSSHSFHRSALSVRNRADSGGNIA